MTLKASPRVWMYLILSLGGCGIRESDPHGSPGRIGVHPTLGDRQFTVRTSLLKGQWKFQMASCSLSDTKLLICGGHDANYRASGQTLIYDGRSGTLTSAGDMVFPRYGHLVLPLGFERALAIGGVGTERDCEVFDAATGQWSVVDNVADDRIDAAAVVLQDGRILVCGGRYKGRGLRSVEIFDPHTKKWKTAASMREGRFLHRAVRLSDGRVLVLGGLTSDIERIRHVYREFTVTSACEIYDPTGDQWTQCARMYQKRAQFSADRLPDGRIIAVGGVISETDWTNLTEIYDPMKDSWIMCQPLPQFRVSFEALTCPDGTFLVIGGMGDPGGSAPQHVDVPGIDVSRCFAFDPSALDWKLGPRTAIPLRASFAATVVGRSVLVVGGTSRFGVSEIEALEIP